MRKIMGVMGALFVRRKEDFFLNDFKYFHICICGSFEKNQTYLLARVIIYYVIVLSNF